MRGTRARRAGGFTLQELMVVVVIVGIAGAVAASRLSGRGRESRDARRFAERITQTLEYARVRAVATRRFYRVTVAPKQLTIDSSLDGATAWTTEDVQQAPGEALVWDTTQLATPPGAQSTGIHTIRFAPDFTVIADGGPAVNANVWVAGVDPTITHAGQAFKISVIATGAVRLIENW